ncbi:MAG: hypothetical protein HY014_15765 [Acidobacteria bacterium]|nr:hypothetical protein [Acidobacteriota bacterium]MBI3489615.1 hypothetical protein [Acidobacteriota bacterium]
MTRAGGGTALLSELIRRGAGAGAETDLNTKDKEHHQDVKTPRKTSATVYAVLLGIACGDTRDKKKLGALVSWW